MIKLSIIVSTIGRATLARTLSSIQLAAGDEVLVAMDGVITPEVQTIWDNSHLPGQLIAVPGGPHYDWGNAARTYAITHTTGTHVLYSDDDDIYAPAALETVRQTLSESPEALHFFQQRFLNGKVIWQHPFLLVGGVCTGLFCHPTNIPLGTWGTQYEGDYQFIRQTIQYNPGRPVRWIPEVISLCRACWEPQLHQMNKEPINCLWVGGKLSVIERLSLASYVHNGHPVHLHTYGEVGPVPAGVVLVDANTILPERNLFAYRLQWHQRSNYSAFADVFRFKLLSEQGGWWSDVDVICLRPLEFTAPYVIPMETDHGKDKPTSCVLRAPAGSSVYADAFEKTQYLIQTQPPAGGLVGPPVVEQLVKDHDLQEFLVPAAAFCPLPFTDWEQFTKAGVVQCHLLHTMKESWGAHLWHEFWLQAGIDKNKPFHPVSQIEIWKRHYLPC